jgi:hypothetical protein
MVAMSAGKGIASFCRSIGIVWVKRGKIIAAVVLSGLQGQRPVRQRSLSADLIFGSFYQKKEQSQPAAIERANVIKYN